MEIKSFSEDYSFNDKRVVVKVILESSFSKEIKIMFKEGQIMKEHKAPYPIVVHILKGQIDFGVSTDVHTLKEGNIITLEANVLHDLRAKQDSIVRLTLSKLDDFKRVVNLKNNQ